MTDEKQGAEVPKKTRKRGPNKSKIVEPVTVDNVEVKEVAISIEFVTTPKSRNEAPQYRVYVGGIEQWYTKAQITIGMQRGFDIKLPEGSPFDVPAESRCSNCGG